MIGRIAPITKLERHEGPTGWAASGANAPRTGNCIASGRSHPVKGIASTVSTETSVRRRPCLGLALTRAAARILVADASALLGAGRCPGAGGVSVGSVNDLSKYALVERERRFLVAGVPEGVVEVRQIVDFYLDGTRLRLRK